MAGNGAMKKPRCLQWMRSREDSYGQIEKSMNGKVSPEDLFPPNVVDEHGEQIDLRNRNSWWELASLMKKDCCEFLCFRTLNLPEVPLRELLQVLTVNAVGPFLLTSRLKALMLKSPAERKFIVNVSAMEGQVRRDP